MSTNTVQERISSPISPDFEEIYRAHAALVFRTAWGVLGSREDAEDVLQTVFVKLLRRELPPDIEKSPKSYLYRAAVNAALDTLKAKRRRPIVLMDESGCERKETPSPSSEPEFDEELHERLYAAIGQLSAEAAESIVFRYMQGKSTAEIAATLGVSRTVVLVRLFRARAHLKKLLGRKQS
jgi:RNA polymerase sigma-70 factor (ECF subfamily)